MCTDCDWVDSSEKLDGCPFKYLGFPFQLLSLLSPGLEVVSVPFIDEREGSKNDFPSMHHVKAGYSIVII